MIDPGRKRGDKPSYPICVWNGIFDHYEKIGVALWEFLWLVDAITKEQDGIGWVHGKAPVRIARIAQDFGICEKSVRLHLNQLKAFGYIITKKTPFGLVIGVQNSRKIRWPKSGNSLPQSRTESGKSFPETGQKLPDQPVSSYRSKEDKAVDKAIDSGESTAAASQLNPWKLLGTDLPMGSPTFQRVFEHYAATRGDVPISEAMERTIQAANRRGLGVPPKFYKSKREVEHREAQELSKPVGAIPELEAEPWRQ